MSAPLVGTKSAALSIERVKYTHDAMIDLLINNPAISQNELAKAFGYSAAWISRVVNSDAFLARLAERKEDVIDPVLSLSMEEKIRALADQSLKVISDKLALTQNPDTAMKAFEISTRALGYGARQQNVNVQQNFVVALPAKVPDAQVWAERGKAAGAEAALSNAGVQLVERVQGPLTPMAAFAHTVMTPTEAG